MKLWLIKRIDHVGYDEYDSAVVVAETEDAARLIHPTGSAYLWNGTIWKDGNWSDNVWADPATLKVQEVGIASPGITGVVCASFNAG